MQCIWHLVASFFKCISILNVEYWNFGSIIMLPNRWTYVIIMFPNCKCFQIVNTDFWNFSIMVSSSNGYIVAWFWIMMKVVVLLYATSRLAVRIVDFHRVSLSVKFWAGPSRYNLPRSESTTSPVIVRTNTFICMHTCKHCPGETTGPDVFACEPWESNCQTWWLSWYFVFLHRSSYWSRKCAVCRHNGDRITPVLIHVLSCSVRQSISQANLSGDNNPT